MRESDIPQRHRTSKIFLFDASSSTPTAAVKVSTPWTKEASWSIIRTLAKPKCKSRRGRFAFGLTLDICILERSGSMGILSSTQDWILHLLPILHAQNLAHKITQ